MPDNILPFPKRKPHLAEEARNLQAQGLFTEALASYRLALDEHYDKTVFIDYIDLHLHIHPNQMLAGIWEQYIPDLQDIVGSPVLFDLYLETQRYLDIHLAMAHLYQLRDALPPHAYEEQRLIQQELQHLQVNLRLQQQIQTLNNEADILQFIQTIQKKSYNELMETILQILTHATEQTYPLLLTMITDPFLPQEVKAHIMRFLIDNGYDQPVRFSLFNRLYTIVPKDVVNHSENYTTTVIHEIEQFFERVDPYFVSDFIEYFQIAYSLCFPFFEDLYPDPKIWFKLALEAHHYAPMHPVHLTSDELELFELLDLNVQIVRSHLNIVMQDND